ncbi:MAG: hypothetical protein AAFQ80_01190 [Cyanobacteria bacterium J06621_8]
MAVINIHRDNNICSESCQSSKAGDAAIWIKAIAIGNHVTQEP